MRNSWFVYVNPETGQKYIIIKGSQNIPENFVYTESIITEEELRYYCLEYRLYPLLGVEPLGTPIYAPIQNLVILQEISLFTFISIAINFIDLLDVNVNWLLQVFSEGDILLFYRVLQENKTTFCEAINFIYGEVLLVNLHFAVYNLVRHILGRDLDSAVLQNTYDNYLGILDMANDRAARAMDIPVDMAAPPINNNELEELRKHYAGTVLKTKEETPEWVFIQGFQSPLVVSIKRECSNFAKSESMAMEKVDFTPLKAGVYNLPYSIVLVNKIPNRQWRRGVSENTYNFFTYRGYLDSIYKRVYGRSSYDLNSLNKLIPQIPESCTAMAILLNQVEVTKNIPESLDTTIEDLLSNKRMATTIDSFFWISQGFMDKDLLLFYKTSIIGKISNNFIIIENKYFKQEVIDLVRRTNTSLEVV